MSRLLIYLPVLLLVLSGCKNTPRKSSRELQQIEASKEQYMLEWNKRMAEQQDSLFSFISDTSAMQWQKSEKGYYYSIAGLETGKKIETGDIITISYILKTIMNEAIDSSEVTFVAGKSQDIPIGIQNAVLQLRENQIISLLLPFNLAYGVKGIPGKVLPFQPLRVKVAIEKVEKR